ncbi:FAD-dependent oxidoreductase [Parerythrobacter lacustris]|uniref:FAD-binding oxidoreductase n=1 Tax=Parerythrobacter lacustris TaxID=2969984 RepID=A0ABT1XQG1_9SPHN|nr:FAD-dependent oxidoreductase [Parerythrobacter lacustris]MCR2833893.1 FAD-binding oxidoreductase [Parerythrobacter lacustris]
MIVNCMGYGAKAIWGDDSLVPVRGQIAWLVPQPEARYALWFDQVQAISRRDGLIVQYLGPNDDWGYDNADESPDRAESERALATLRELYS